MRISLLLAVLALALGACDGTTDDDFTPQLVVAAQLGAGEPLPSVRLTRTSPFLDVYDPTDLGVVGATVTVTRTGADEAVYVYVPTQTPGVYAPADASVTVTAGTTYRLRVEADGETVTAETTVPPTLLTVGEPQASVVYGVGQGPEVRVNRTSTAERQATFVATTRALDPADFVEVDIDGETFYRSVPGSGFLLTPIYARILDCEDEESGTILCAEDPRDDGIRSGTSPVINEASYIDLGDGSLLVQVPFLAFGYYGPSRVSLVSLDAALQAFVQTQAVQLGGSTLSPGEIPNVTTNVVGGLGLFGSYARVSNQTEIVEP